MVAKLITTLTDAGIELYLDNGKLKAKAQKGALTAQMAALIKEHKDGLIAHLQQHQGEQISQPATRYVPWLSYAQQRLWFIDKLGQGSVQYNIPGRFVLPIEVDIAALKQALAALLDRHEVLRTHFIQVDDKPRQVIRNRYELPFIEHDLSDLCDEQKRGQVLALIKEEALKPFDLSADLMLRMRVIKLAKANHLLLYTQHHIASDGWSMNILQQELTELYHAFAQGKPNPLPPLSIQYADYAKWQLDWLQGEVLHKQLAYWQTQLADAPNVHQLSLSHKRPAQQRFEAGRFRYSFDPQLSSAIKQLCERYEVTLYMFLQSAYALLISRFSNSHDILMGTPIAGRTHKDVERLLGFFVNSLVLRTRIDGEMDFAALLKANKYMILDAYEYQHVPFEMLVEKLCPQRDLAYNPIFQLLFVVQNNEQGLWDTPLQDQVKGQEQGEKAQQQSKDIGEAFATTRFDLELHVYESAERLSFKWVRSTSLIEHQDLVRLAEAFERLLRSIVADLQTNTAKTTKVTELAIIDQTELDKLQHQWQIPHQLNELPKGQEATITELFEQQVQLTPDNIAVCADDLELTYTELNDKANQIAAVLHAQGVKVGDYVALCVERNELMPIAVLGILKAGGAYVPLDPDYPSARLAYLLDDCGANVVLKQHNTLEDVEVAQTVVLIESLLNEQANEQADETQSDANAASKLTDKVSGSHPAYLIYTSGSTGQPKGVVVSHQNVLNYLHHGKSYLNDEIVGSVVSTALVFDATVCSLWLPLVNGLSVELLPQDGNMIDTLIDFLLDDEPLLFKLTPSHMTAAINSQMLSVNHNTEHVLVVGGEQLTGSLLAKWSEYFPACIVINEYGPTEATVGCSVYQCQLDTVAAMGEQQLAGLIDANVPVGKPIENARLYVLNEAMNFVPIGVPGELYIGGSGVTDGYVGRPAVTAERFVPDPFAHNVGQGAGQRLYRSGDLVRWRADGELEFIRRIDEQVKVRGFRIEPGEIEVTLEQADILSNVLVNVVRKTDEQGYQQGQLLAYVCPSMLWLDRTAASHNQDNVSQWTDVFDDAYSDPTIEYEASLNYAGWDSSYTGLPIAIEQMDEWLDETLRVIKDLKPQKMLEIGCGMGLLLLRYSEYCQQVHAVDISVPALMNVKGELQRRQLSHVQLSQGDALSIGQLPTELKFDTIVCNSVAQYFPNLQYFEQTLSAALSRLEPNGKILFGDIRNLDLFEPHVVAVEYGRMTATTDLQTLARRSQRRMQQEQELLFSPSYFIKLKSRFADIGRVDILVKRGVSEHEMVRYRYEVVITKTAANSSERDSQSAITWFDYHDIEQIEALLKTGELRSFAVSGVDNPRISDDLALCQQLKDIKANIQLKPPVSPGQLAPQIIEKVSAFEQLWQKAEALGYQVALTWSQGQLDTLDVYFSRDKLPEIQARAPYSQAYLANHPLLSSTANQYTEELKGWLAQQLPKYMLPDVFVVLERMPLTINGKIDRKALPIPDENDLQKASFVAPRTDTERQLCEIWQQVLGLNQVGINDNFFALGGHSLLAIRLISRIRREFDVELQLKVLFESATVALLAEHLNIDEDTFVLPPVTCVSRDEPLVLSYAQQRLWFIDQLGQGSTEYNMRGKHLIEGPFNREALELALQQMIARHEVLRTNFVSVDGEPLQRIVDDFTLPLSFFDISDSDDSKQQAELERHIQAEADNAFDLAADLMVRVRLIKLSQTRHMLLYTIHHIAGDGWSIDIFQQEFSRLYQAFVDGENSPLEPLTVQYADYAKWQRGWLQGQLLEQQLDYWKQQLNDMPVVHSLPLDRPRPPRQSNVGRGLTQVLDGKLAQQLKELAQQQNVTLFMLLQSAYALLLSRYSNHQDIIMGSPVSGRSHSDIESLIGFFVNTLVLRSKIDKQWTFAQLLSHNKQMVLDAYAHQHVPFEMLVDELLHERDMSYNALFQLLFDVQSQAGFLFPNAPSTEKYRQIDRLGVRFDLAVHVSDYRDGISIRWSYRDTLFDDETIQRLAQNFEVLLANVVDSVGVKADEGAASENQQPYLYQHQFIDADERQKLVHVWNDTAAETPACCVHQLIEQQVQLTPDNIAIVDDQTELTYQQYNQQANQLGTQLRQLGVGPDVVVALCIERSSDFMLALLAVHKAGGCYLPIDVSYPQERIEYMLADSGAKVVISQSSVQHDLPLGELELLCIDQFDTNATLSTDNISAQEIGLTPEHLAYVIYTSGSTGKPKGVMVIHANVVNFLSAVKAPFLLDGVEGSVVSSAVAFDATVQSLFLPLINGQYVEVLAEDEELIATLADYIVDDEARLLFKLTPTHLKALAQSGFVTANDAVNHVLVVAGEQLSKDILTPWYQELLPNAVFINEYGPTECTVGSCIYPISDGDLAASSSAIPIGKPLANYRFYVLDEYMTVQPIGGAGELYIGGAGVARGYLGRDDLNAERFVADGFSDDPTARLYRTGDLVRWLANGNIEFLGRIDQQVKLRGFRIEPGEIEAELKQHSALSDALVMVRNIEHDVKLIAYVVANQQHNEQQSQSLVEQLSAHLQQQLPSYMVPSLIVVLDEMPQTSNGKVDRNALPEPGAAANKSNHYVAPRTALETTLCEIWQSILGVAEVGIHDNFFVLGGHSLLATRLISRVRQTLNVELKLRELFEYPTVAGLAQLFADSDSRFVLPPIEVTPAGENIPLSYAQQRLWFIDQLSGGKSIQYNMPGRYLLNGELDTQAFKRALETIIERHQVLKSNIVMVDGQGVLARQSNIKLPYQFHDLSDLSDADKGQVVEQLIAEEATSAFDLSRDLMLRTRAIKLKPQQYLILFTLHHIASDGWSMGVMTRELGALYSAFSQGQDDPLPALKVQYGDYARWQRQWLQGDVLKQQLDYWQQQLDGMPKLHGLPLDKPRPAQQTFEGGRFRQVLDATRSAKLKMLCEQYQITPFMLLQTAFAILIGRYSGRDDVVLGTPVAGRSHQDIEGLIGFFVNSLVLRSQLSNNPDLIDLLIVNRRHVLDGYAHQHIPFEMLVEALNPERDPSFNPLFQILFTVQNNEQAALDLQSAEQTAKSGFKQVLSNRLNATFTRTRFDLEVQVIEVEDCLTMRWIYNLALFEFDSMVQLSTSFMVLIDSVIDSLHQHQGKTPINTLALVAEPASVQPTLANQSQTVCQLMQGANIGAVAAQLHGLNLAVGQLLAVSVQQPLEVIAEVLACGYGFVYIDPDMPSFKIAGIIERANVATVIVDEATVERVNQAQVLLPEVALTLVFNSELSEINQPITDGVEIDSAVKASIASKAREVSARDAAMWIDGDVYHQGALAAIVSDFNAIDGMLRRVMFASSAMILSQLQQFIGAEEHVIGAEDSGDNSQAPLQAILRHGQLLAPRGAIAELVIIGEGLPNNARSDNGSEYHTQLLVREGCDQQLRLCQPFAGREQQLAQLQQCIAKLSAVEQVKVVDDELVGSVCYYRGDIDELALGQQLRQLTPKVALPRRMIRVEQMALDNHGLVVVKDLPRPWLAEQGLATARYLAPRNDVEQRLVNIWQAILKLERVGVKDNFFEIGGHSLLAARLVSRIRDEFDKEIALSALFEHPSVAALASHIASLAKHQVLAPVVASQTDGPRDLSYAQQRLWFIDRLGQAGASYNIAGRISWPGELDQQVFVAAVNTLLTRHQVLRSVYIDGSEQPQQLVLKDFTPAVDFVDLSELKGEQRAQKVQQYIDEQGTKPFDLSADLMLRFTVLKVAAEQHLVLYTLHHIAADGWSRGILQNELQALYLAYGHGRVNPLPRLKVQYSDYATWQRQWMSGEVLQHQLSYWQEQLQDMPTVHALALDKPRPAQLAYVGRKVLLVLDNERTAKLKAMAADHEVTLFMLLQSAFATLIGRLSDADDVVMATPVAGRNHSDIEPLIGFFINTLVLRSDLANVSRFSQLLHHNKAMFLAALAHQDLPFEMLVEHLSPARQLNYSPLAQILFALQNNELGFADQQLNIAKDIERGVARQINGQFGIKFDLELNVMEVNGELTFSWGYDQNLFVADSVINMAESLALLLDIVVNNPEVALYDLPVLSAKQQRLPLEVWHQHQQNFVDAVLIDKHIERYAQTSPDATALIFGQTQISYQTLNQQANRLARQLQHYGVSIEHPVGICLARGPQLIVAVVAVLKAGGCYLPLDSQYPVERLVHQITDSGCTLCLVDDLGRQCLTEQVLPQLSSNADELKLLDAQQDVSLADDNLDLPRHPNQLAYIIYTSGSTGTPKGVGVTHQGWANLAAAQVDRFGVTHQSRCLQFASMAFDAAAFEMSLAFASGASLCLLSAAEAQSPQGLSEVINAYGLTHATLPGAILSYLDADNVALDTLIVAGEAVSTEVAQRWSQTRKGGKTRNFINAYGPTETTVCATAGLYRDGEITIGDGLTNVPCYVLDRFGQLLPQGAVGELYVGGVQLARGYLGRGGLTAKQFVPNPFARKAGERLYATGDLVRQLADGRLLFVGRVDHQIKIRGFRIEPGEIEQQLLRQPHVADCAVIAVEHNEQPMLVAYVVNKAADDIDETQLKQLWFDGLAAVLPQHMRPSVYLLLDKIPLTNNGKLDRAALPKVQSSDLYRAKYVAPSNHTQTVLCQLWQQVLKLEQVGIEDDFFTLGGHSLLVTRLANLIREQFNQEVPLRMLFEQTTVAGQSGHIFATAEQQQMFENQQQLNTSDVDIEEGEL